MFNFFLFLGKRFILFDLTSSDSSCWVPWSGNPLFVGVNLWHNISTHVRVVPQSRNPCTKFQHKWLSILLPPCASFSTNGLAVIVSTCPFILPSKVTFPNLPPAQGYASPSRKLVLPQIDHNYEVGVICVYNCVHMYRLPVFYFISYGARNNQYFDLLELQRLHLKIHRSRTVQIHHSLVAGSASRSWLNFFERKKKKKNAKQLSQLHALEPARYAVIIPGNTY